MLTFQALDAVDLALADQLAHLYVVEADVVAILRAARDEAVVVDHLQALRLGIRLDRRARSRVEGIDEEHRRTGGDVRLGLLLHRARAAMGVVDLELVGREPSGFEGFLQVRRVVLDVARRRRRVGEQDADHSLAFTRKVFELGHRREVRRQIVDADLRGAGRFRCRSGAFVRVRSAATAATTKSAMLASPTIASLLHAKRILPPSLALGRNCRQGYSPTRAGVSMPRGETRRDYGHQTR